MKLNNKGQVLVLFVVMLPILFFLLAYFIDNMIILGKKDNLNNINEIIIKYAMENKDNEGIYDAILDLALKNDKNIVITKFKIYDDVIELELLNKVDSIFGKIIGIKTYDVISSYTANIDSNGVIRMGKK